MGIFATAEEYYGAYVVRPAEVTDPVAYLCDDSPPAFAPALRRGEMEMSVATTSSFTDSRCAPVASKCSFRIRRLAASIGADGRQLAAMAIIGVLPHCGMKVNSIVLCGTKPRNLGVYRGSAIYLNAQHYA